MHAVANRCNSPVGLWQNPNIEKTHKANATSRRPKGRSLQAMLGVLGGRLSGSGSMPVNGSKTRNEMQAPFSNSGGHAAATGRTQDAIPRLHTGGPVH